MAQAEPETGAAGYTLVHDADLAELTTFRVAARARLMAELHETAALPALMSMPEIGGARRVLVLGGGSNVLFTRDFDGLVVRVATRGIELRDESGGRAGVRVAAGESWDAFVRWALHHGFGGLENLIRIPGTVGAAPIQNIGAYGAELAEFVDCVEVWDRARSRFDRLDVGQCEFAYRDSRFKREPERYLVTWLQLELRRDFPLRLDYTGVREELKAMRVGTATRADVARAVERLRLRKLPDPAQIGNAGSFFKNPVVATERAAELRRRYPALPAHAAGTGLTKLAAAWLIEACGFKGIREGDVGVSDKHALVLVNYGKASGADVLALAGRIRAAVRERFGVILEAEPVIR